MLMVLVLMGFLVDLVTQALAAQESSREEGWGLMSSLGGDGPSHVRSDVSADVSADDYMRLNSYWYDSSNGFMELRT
jgi:hypothetical protein